MKQNLQVSVSEADHILEADHNREGDHIREGNAQPGSNASAGHPSRQGVITLVEYGDFECPDAGRAYPMIKRVREHFGDRLRFVFRHFPLTDIHPLAEPAAETAEFAASKGRFWEMHDALYENQQSLSLAGLLEVADALGLDAAELKSALQTRAFLGRVESDVQGGLRSGVHGTPTFFVNDAPYDGPWKFRELVEAIDEAAQS